MRGSKSYPTTAGSASIAQLSDAVIGLERDQQSDKNGGDTTVESLKIAIQNRVACTLAYNQKLKLMKQNQTKSSTQQQILKTPHQQAMLTRPKPPTEEAIKKHNL